MAKTSTSYKKREDVKPVIPTKLTNPEIAKNEQEIARLKQLLNKGEFKDEAERVELTEQYVVQLKMKLGRDIPVDQRDETTKDLAAAEASFPK